MTNACGYEGSSGVTLSRGEVVPGPVTFEPIGGIIEMPQLNWSAAISQCTGFDSAVPDGSGQTWAEYFKTGLFDQDEVTLLVGLLPGNAVQDKLWADFNDIGVNSNVPFRIQIPNAAGDTLGFSALVINWGLSIPQTDQDNNQMNIPITMRPSGKPDWIIP